MTTNELQEIEAEFYIPHEIRLNDIVTITLYRKASTETFYESKDVLNSFQNNEDFFISWLSKISSSKGYPVARAIAKVNGTIIEALYSSDKLKYFIDFPYISRIKRIYVVQKLKPHESMLNASSQEEGNPHLTPNQENDTLTNIIQDLSNDELYIFFSPINVVDPSKADALVLETERGIIFLRLDSIPRISSSTTTTKTAAKRKKRRSSKKKKKKSKTRKSSKSSS